MRVSAAQERREECAAYEDPRARVRAGEGQVGAGRCCARARQAQTVAERLRREGARVHEDTRFDVGAARPLANLRHVMCECAGTPDRQERVNGLVLALDGLVRAGPSVQGNAAYHRVTRAARAALEAAAQVVLSEAQWRHVVN